ncbi:MAG: Uma2 family endonuclease [Blastocatellia bacterium]
MLAEDLLKIPRGQYRHELHKGRLITKPLSAFADGIVTMRITWRLASHVERHTLGVTLATGTGFHLGSNPDTVLAPEIAFVRQARVQANGLPEGFWPGPPDLAVLVVSPNDSYREISDKVAEWLSAGTKEVWVVNPKRKTLTIHRSMTEALTLGASDELDGGQLLPGFRLRIEKIFA